MTMVRRLALGVGHDPTTGLGPQIARLGHPVERLVRLPVRMDRHRAVGLDHEQSGRPGQVGRQAAHVVDRAGGDHEPHRPAIVPDANGPPRTRPRPGLAWAVLAPTTTTDDREPAAPGPRPSRRWSRLSPRRLDPASADRCRSIRAAGVGRRQRPPNQERCLRGCPPVHRRPHPCTCRHRPLASGAQPARAARTRGRRTAPWPKPPLAVALRGRAGLCRSGPTAAAARSQREISCRHPLEHAWPVGDDRAESTTPA